MSEHTPGPWREYLGWIVATDDRVVVTMPKPHTEHEADALLIVAAPDLLAALEAIQWQWDDRSEARVCVECDLTEAEGHAPSCAIGKAIAKARGQAVTS